MFNYYEKNELLPTRREIENILNISSDTIRKFYNSNQSYFIYEAGKRMKPTEKFLMAI